MNYTNRARHIIKNINIFFIIDKRKHKVENIELFWLIVDARYLNGRIFVACVIQLSNSDSGPKEREEG